MDARLSSGRSRVRVPYGARVGSRRGRGGCWLPIRTFNPGRAGSIPVHGTPHAPPWSSGQGRPVLNREDAGSSPAEGTDALVAEPADAPPSSSGAPVACGFDSHREHEVNTPTCRNGRRAALRARCPSGREGSTPSVGTSGRGQVSRLALQVRRPGSIPRRSTSRHGGEPVYADEAHVDAHLLAMQETAGSRPVIRSIT